VGFDALVKVITLALTGAAVDGINLLGCLGNTQTKLSIYVLLHVYSVKYQCNLCIHFQFNFCSFVVVNRSKCPC